MRLRIIRSTDGKYLGDTIEVPVPSLGTLSKQQIQALATGLYDGRFIPDSVSYPTEDSVRLVNSNYSVTFEVVENG